VNNNSEIRKHYFLDKYVVIAPGRIKRPMEIAFAKSDSSKCNFCPGHEEANPNEILRLPKNSKGPNWQIRVIPNRYPALSPDNPKAYGYQEIVVETPKHGESIGDFSLEHLEQLIEVYSARTEALSNMPHIRYALVFKNNGGQAGASIVHAHSQIFALPITPPEAAHEAIAEDQYEELSGRCVWCEIMQKERKGPRLIAEDEHMVAFAPYASSAPYEAWILPRRHRRALHDLNGVERHSLALILRSIISRLEEHGIPYNYFIHNSVELEDHHLHIEIIPRSNTWGGFELGAGIVVNPVAPETVPDFYRGSDEVAPV
jgi:UDPglucose--hexose-1-phosphate uridylyltransferase